MAAFGRCRFTIQARDMDGLACTSGGDVFRPGLVVTPVDAPAPTSLLQEVRITTAKPYQAAGSYRSRLFRTLMRRALSCLCHSRVLYSQASPWKITWTAPTQVLCLRVGMACPAPTSLPTHSMTE